MVLEGRRCSDRCFGLRWIACFFFCCCYVLGCGFSTGHRTGLEMRLEMASETFCLGRLSVFASYRSQMYPTAIDRFEGRPE